MTQTPNPRQTNSDISDDKPRKGLCEMKDHWWDRKTDEVQKYADSNNSKQLIRALKTVYRPTQSGPTFYYQMMDQHWSRTRRPWENDGQNISANYWTDFHQSAPLHLTRFLSSPFWMSLITCHQSLSSWSHPPDKLWLNTRKRWNPAELYKAAGPEAIDVFDDILSCIWEQEKMPEDFWDALIVVLYKNKGSKADCRNYRDISLLSIARKILAWIILNQLITMSEANLPEAKCGFHSGHSMVKMIFSVRQV